MSDEVYHKYQEGDVVIFDYECASGQAPMDDYALHSGWPVVVLAPHYKGIIKIASALTYTIVAADGWQGTVFERELTPVAYEYELLPLDKLEDET